MSENSEKILKVILEKQEVIEKLLILLIPNLKIEEMLKLNACGVRLWRATNRRCGTSRNLPRQPPALAG